MRFLSFHEDSRDFHTKNDHRDQQSTNEDDHYVADLIVRYGEADESARRQWGETQRHHQTQEQSQENTKTPVKL